MLHNLLVKLVIHIFFATALLAAGPGSLRAQDSEQADDDDGTSERVEQRDDSYRQQMELEDARSRDRTYIDNTYTQKANQEKIDKLPTESRENIRDQLVDIIVENGEWEPKDALAEYPYTPTAAAEADSELMQQEQEAWDEQIEKYHEREAAAFGTHRGPVPGPGNPTGAEGGQQGEGQQQGEQGSGGQQGGGQDGSGQSGAGSAGTYQPYESSSSTSEDEVSTAGVSESALDFLRGGQGRQQTPPSGAGGSPGTGAETSQQSQQQAQQAQQQAQQQARADEQAQQQAQAEAEAQQQAQQQLAEQQASESQQEEQQAQNEQQAEQEASEQAQNEQQSADTPEIDTRGIIAIKDLNKLEGAGEDAQEEDQEDR